MHRILIPLFTSMAFISLCHYSLRYEGYDIRDIERLNQMVASAHGLTKQQRADRDILYLYGENAK